MRRTALLILFLFLGSNLSAHPSWGLVRDDMGNFYFADIMHNGRGSVWQLTPSGELILLLRDFHAHNVSLDEDDLLVTAHGEEHHTMVRLNREGSIDTLISRNDHHEFFGGNCTYTPWGEIIFCIEGYLWRIDDNGNREKINEHHLEWNQCLLATDNGTIYAPDIGNGRGELWRFTPGGEAELIATDLITRFEDREYDRHDDVLLGMAVDDNNRVYISEKAGQRVIRIAADGETSDFYKSTGFWFPTGLTFHHQKAYILEYEEGGEHGGPRITEVNQDGSVRILFDYASYGTNEKSEGAVLDTATRGTAGWPVAILFLSGILLLGYVLFRGLKN